MKQKFIMMISGRSGSSYLKTLIEQDGRILMRGEILARKQAEAQKKIIADFYSDKIGDLEHSLIGFKTKLNDIIDLNYFRQQIINHQPIIIINRRKNYLRQAISRARMLVLLEKTQAKYGRGHHSPQCQADIIGKIKVDVDWIYRFTLDFANRDRQLEQLALSLPHTETIFYEEFAQQPQVAIDRLSQILGIELQVNKLDTTFKNTPTDLTQAIANYDELETKLANTDYLSMLYSV